LGSGNAWNAVGLRFWLNSSTQADGRPRRDTKSGESLLIGPSHESQDFALLVKVFFRLVNLPERPYDVQCRLLKFAAFPRSNALIAMGQHRLVAGIAYPLVAAPNEVWT
jgi:hypothetical protein